MNATSRSWAIIGVVGRTFKARDAQDGKQQELLQLAKRAGACVADRGHAVLTGGHHKMAEPSVKCYALLGAMERMREGVVRLIGIVPEQISGRLNPPIQARQIETGRDENDSVRYLYAHTQLESARRNAITGAAVDVLIALQGRIGTPSEVAAAFEAGRPVVFLRSLEVLREPVTGILTGRSQSRMFPAEPCQAETAEEAVEKALSLIGWGSPSQRLSGKFRCAGLEEDYERALVRL